MVASWSASPVEWDRGPFAVLSDNNWRARSVVARSTINLQITSDQAGQGRARTSCPHNRSRVRRLAARERSVTVSQSAP